jgi:plastocyanin
MRKLAVLVAVATLGALGSSGVGLADHTNADHSVEILGGTTITPGESIQNDWRFEARDIEVNPGDTVAWHSVADEAAPHTVTLVRQSKLPQDLAEMEECYAPGQPCASALNRHGNRQNRRIIVEDDQDNERGLDEPRDSRWIKVNETFTARISADEGTTLYYLCAQHPWMQGSIDVVAAP